MNLVIVESPSKAKTIQKFLGDNFVVTSSMGHIRDLPGNDKAIDIEHGFTPTYEVTADKKKIVADLKKQAAKAETIWLATDEDREGEAIAWHLMEALELPPQKVRRIVFHEITKKAIQAAVEKPRSVDIALVDAQQARRILDRLVGFGLSPVLWRKVQRNLSAGRVQSVAVRLVVEREREIQAFTVTSQFRIQAEFQKNGRSFTAELPRRFDTETEARTFLEKCKGALFHVQNLEIKPGKKSPSAPFTTSTLQQEASRKLGYSLARTMKLAQDLYEAGHITYMRTDSVNLSDVAISAASEYIGSSFGAEYVQTRRYTTTVASAQEAHEAIRPTDVSKKSAGTSEAHKKLYDLIWKRTLASQMADARLEKTVATIGISTTPETLTATGEMLAFDGFLHLYMESSDEENDQEDAKMLPPLAVDEKLDAQAVRAQERFARPPARYTEASLVKKLEELGIGRPSTYAPTIGTIQSRNYVVKEDRDGKQREVRELVLNLNTETIAPSEIQRIVKTENTGQERNKLFPTGIGSIVTDFLLLHFEGIMDYNFTASVEKQFDEIAHGKLQWQSMISAFYGPFKETLDKTSATAERQSGERHLGTDPKTGKPVTIRLARYGPIAQIGDSDDPDKKQKGLAPAMSMETVTLEEALALFRFPRVVGDYEGQPVVVKIGRFGPYIEHNGMFASIPSGEDPGTVSIERSIELIEAKKKAVAERLIKIFNENPDVQILKGRWGPFLKIGKDNYRIPKGTDAAALTLAECLALAESQSESAPAKPERAVKKTAARKSAAKKPASRKSVTKKSE
ncbi:MAG: type I DNA topoisomerase [Chlorobi bacterium]|nr:MAG: type I DNA topoisomerase [Bacteroidota bacterium]MBE2265603.1 type I DNA topoisomerase [Flavobacteriales bacterium]MBL1161698.1 type I DNA topoisomerase [Chlorobiota bacterium]MBW7853941.1 type I DNA topoisomerase [Candidatus Kapabacteria bacterium]MCC6331818.1 type I DNA topoisomerase [Ignavibacteria bacterium]